MRCGGSSASQVCVSALWMEVVGLEVQFPIVAGAQSFGFFGGWVGLGGKEGGFGGRVMEWVM